VTNIGRFTRVETEITGMPVGEWAIDELATRTPGKETLATVEARRSAALNQFADDRPAMKPERATAEAVLPPAGTPLAAVSLMANWRWCR
jgi:hypothetical protein